MYKSIKNYYKSELGHFVNYVTSDKNQPFQLVRTYSENVTETPSASYINDDWFKYITGESHNPRFVIDGDDLSTASNLISIADDFILNNFSHRFLFDDDFSAICNFTFEPLTTSEPSACMLFTRMARMKIRALFESKREEYKRLWEIQTAEYDPLIDNDSKITTTHSGTDTRANTGTDTMTHSGTDTTTHSGTDTTSHSGKDTVQNSGTDSTAHTGTDSTAHTGTETNADSGSDNSVNSIYPFDTGVEVAKEKDVNTYGKSETTTYNTTDALTHGESVSTSHGLKTETTHGESVSTLHGESVATLHGHSIATLHGKSETTTHGEKIVVEKESGNREPAELLKDHRRLWESFNFLEMVCYDVVKCVSCP